MPIIEFGEWLPDQPDFGNPGCLTAKNVFPTARGFAPVPALEVTTGALDDYPRGAIAVRDADGNVLQYAGDEEKLYQRSGQSWSDVSKSGGYSTGTNEVWEFARWGNDLLATNFSDSPQKITLGGTNFADLTTDLRMRSIAVIRDFVVAGNTFDSTDDAVPNRVRWSAFNDPEDWTVSASTLSDYQDLKTGGKVQKVVGGEFGVIVMERSIWRMSFVGAPVVFQFDEVLPEIGAISPGSVVQDGDLVYFLSERGFFVLANGAQARPIGAHKIDNFVLSDLDQTNAHRMSGTVDVASKRILWAYPGAGNTGGRPNKIVVYDQVLDRFSLIEEEVELIWRSAGVSTTLENLDNIASSLDALPASLDSRQWKGGIAETSAFDEAFKCGSFSGANMTATLGTRELELHSGRQARLNAFRPIVDGGTVTGRVGTRDQQADLVTFGPSKSLRDSGRFTARSNARYHRFELTVSGDWTNALGVEIDPAEAKRGARRG